MFDYGCPQVGLSWVCTPAIDPAKFGEEMLNPSPTNEIVKSDKSNHISSVGQFGQNQQE